MVLQRRYAGIVGGIQIKYAERSGPSKGKSQMRAGEKGSAEDVTPVVFIKTFTRLHKIGIGRSVIHFSPDQPSIRKAGVEMKPVIFAFGVVPVLVIEKHGNFDKIR